MPSPGRAAPHAAEFNGWRVSDTVLGAPRWAILATCRRAWAARWDGVWRLGRGGGVLRAGPWQHPLRRGAHAHGGHWAAVAGAQSTGADLADGIAYLLGAAWDIELEPYRVATEDSPVRVLHHVI